MFDSPFEYCPRCGAMVPLDQTRPECAQVHGCSEAGECPLSSLFSGLGVAADKDAIEEAANGKQS